MPEYKFKARNKMGNEINGQRNALSEEELANQLLKEALIPIDIEIYIDESSQLKKTPIIYWPFNKKVSQDELQIFCRQMETLLRAGIPILTAVTRLAETARDKKLKEALMQILSTLNQGRSLSQALALFPDIFSDFFVNLVKVGENTGHLDEVFRHLSEYIELEEETKKKVKAAIRYPTLVIVSMAVAIVVINIFVMPAFTQMFKQFENELPLPTRILIGTSNFFVSYWYLIIMFIVSMVIIFRRLIKTPRGKLKYAYFKLKIPIIGWILQRITLARFAKLYAMVLRAGLTAVEGIQLVGASTTDAWFADKIKEATGWIGRGNTIALSISKIEIFPPLVIQMITLGEESGKIETLLDNVAEFYQREVVYDLAKLNDSIEPILLLVMAGMVLVLALGVFLPMWDIASKVHV
jgi:MSHA biogenesis protein MshG